jgi:hypothetical protein
MVRVQIIQTHMLSMMSELLRGEYKMVFDMWDRCGRLPAILAYVCTTSPHLHVAPPQGSTLLASTDSGRHCSRTRPPRLQSGVGKC